MTQDQRLTDDERANLTAAAKRLGVQRVARELGISRGAVASLLAGTAQPGTYALVRPAVARLFAELAAFDAASRTEACPDDARS